MGMLPNASEQGGIFFLEPTAVMKIFHCYDSYACCITDLFPFMSSSPKHIGKTEQSPNMVGCDDLSSEEYVQETLITSQQVRWTLFEAFTIGISQISIVLVAEDEAGTCITSLLSLKSCKKVQMF